MWNEDDTRGVQRKLEASSNDPQPSSSNPCRCGRKLPVSAVHVLKNGFEVYPRGSRAPSSPQRETVILREIARVTVGTVVVTTV